MRRQEWGAYKNRPYDRQRGKDSRIPHLVYRFDGHFESGTVVISRKPEMTNDILYNDNGIINKNANRKNKRKQGYSI